mmetsp:Transcript_126844/g.224774  ORF Transcript_126844/g.224774 Transcript_126844/m.224774 type:complete len:158 (-) Transcript_126844:83-556(-)
MCKSAFALALLACLAHGHREQSSEAVGDASKSFAALLLALDPSLAFIPSASGGALHAAQHPAGLGRQSNALMDAIPPEKRWPDEPLFDPLKPDPVFDLPEPDYKNPGIGIVPGAEKLNGRLAMIGFTIAFIQESIFNKGLLEFYGLPYDPGAVIFND